MVRPPAPKLSTTSWPPASNGHLYLIIKRPSRTMLRPAPATQRTTLLRDPTPDPHPTPPKSPRRRRPRPSPRAKPTRLRMPLSNQTTPRTTSHPPLATQRATLLHDPTRQGPVQPLQPAVPRAAVVASQTRSPRPAKPTGLRTVKQPAALPDSTPSPPIARNPPGNPPPRPDRFRGRSNRFGRPFPRTRHAPAPTPPRPSPGSGTGLVRPPPANRPRRSGWPLPNR